MRTPKKHAQLIIPVFTINNMRIGKWVDDWISSGMHSVPRELNQVMPPLPHKAPSPSTPIVFSPCSTTHRLYRDGRCEACERQHTTTDRGRCLVLCISRLIYNSTALVTVWWFSVWWVQHPISCVCTSLQSWARYFFSISDTDTPTADFWHRFKT